MFRSAAASTALFSIGLSAGVIVGYQFAPSDVSQIEALKSQQTQLVVATKSAPTALASIPTSTVPAQQPARADTAPSANDVVIAGKAASPTPVTSAIKIVAVTPEPSPRANWAQQDNAPTVKIAVPGTLQPALRDNPIVIKELTLDVQHALYKAGCHTVRFTSKWDRRTAQAAARFVANRNALLPTDKPDVVLLGLLNTYKGDECGKVCTPSSNGSCDDLIVTASGGNRSVVTVTNAPTSNATNRSAAVRRLAPKRRLRPASQPAPAVRRAQKKKLSWRRKVYDLSSDN